ncbi:MAG: methyl-accepting chemotaxis protein, partial [Bacillota bacterium]
MEAREALQQHEASTNRLVTIICWVGLLLIIGVLLPLGERLGMNTTIFAMWGAGSVALLALGTLMQRLGRLRAATKYLMITLIAAMVISIAFLLPGSNQHLGIWFLTPVMASLYMARPVALYGTGISLAGWVAVLLFNQPAVAGSMTVSRLGLVNALMILLVGVAVYAAGSRFRDLMELVVQAADKEAVLQRLNAMMAEAGRTSTQLAATSSALSQAGQAASDQVEGRLRPTVRELERGSRDTAEAVREAMDSMEQLSQTVNQMAAAAGDQASHVTVAAGIVREMADSTDDVTTLSQSMAREATQAAAAAESGADTVLRSAQGMESLAQAMETAAAEMDRLGQQSGQIGEVVTTIEQFAGQTSLLALNAAIEAARAGEAGRGFAVVAQEVGRLASRSSQATAEITRLIREVQDGIRQSMAAMADARQQAAGGVVLSRTALEALEAIRATVGRTSDSAQQIAGRAELLADRSRRLVSSIEHLAAITEENSAAAEEMAATSESLVTHSRSIGEAAKVSAQVAVEVAGATESIARLVAEIAASAQALDQVAASL